MTEDNLERSPTSGGIIAKQACPKAFRETKKVRSRELRRATTPSPPLPAHLERLANRARDYVAAACAANLRRVYGL
jgi:hypothetical protein